MEKKYFIWVIFTLWCLSLTAQQESLDKQFYYYKGEKMYIQIDYSRISIISERKVDHDNLKGIVSLPAFSMKNEGKSNTRLNVAPVDEVSKARRNDDVFIAEMVFPEKLDHKDYFDIIQRLSQEDHIIKIAPTFSPSNHNLGISNNFYVKLFKEDDSKILYDLAKKHSMQVLGQNEFMPLWFTLSCTRETPLGSIEAANMFFETGLFDCSEPEFLYHNLLASNDTYFSDQWGLKNTGQNGGISGIDIKAEQAWSISTGNNVRVAIFDHGFEMNHPDLVNNTYGTGYDAASNTTPAQVRGSHGTACAGISGAQYNNAAGIAGVAPNSKLMSISIGLFYSDTPQQLANGFNWAVNNGADIISNSWGFIPGWWSYAPSTILENAIDAALTQGRNGKGTIVVFAAGNENDTNIRYPGNSNPNILVVGAISPCGERKSPSSCDNEGWGSCYGAPLDIVAPGVFIPTTDRQGDYGYNFNGASDYSNRDYTHWFNGTSSACPHVAGVAALILSVNPNFTGQQVRDIIENSAQKVRTDLYTYGFVSGRPNGSWHNQMGYGLIDAYAAVQAASGVSCVSNFSNQTVTSNTTITGCSTLTVQNVTVTNNAKFTIISGGEVTFSDFEVVAGSELDLY